jgi:hypothetical protein
MALDITAREANVRDSVKKYFRDNIYTTEGYPITFDKTLTTPKVQGVEVDKWVSIIFGDIELQTLSSFSIEIFCCTKQDSEGFKLAQLRDKVMGYLIDTSRTDCWARIPLYRSSASEAWTVIGYMIPQEIIETTYPDAGDNTKLKSINVRLRWAAVC